MVRLEVFGQPILKAGDEGEDISVVKDRVRKRIRGAVVKDGTTSGSTTTTTTRTNFHWNNALPRLVVTSDTEEFDHTIIEHFQAEGFQVTYLEYKGDHKGYMNQLKHLSDPLDLGEKYAIAGEADLYANIELLDC